MLMRQLASLPGAVFLDSGLGAQDTARFDILSALPTLTLSQSGDRVTCEFAPHIPATQRSDVTAGLSVDTDIFQAVQQALEMLDDPEARQALPDLPFTGGAIGCFAYGARRDLVTFRQRESTYFAPDALVGIYHWAIVIDHLQQRSTLFFMPQCPETLRLQVSECLSTAAVPADFALTSMFAANMSKTDYRQAFDRLKALIMAGDCYQANLAQSFRATFRGQPIAGYLALRAVSHSPFSAYMQLPDGAVLSLSPERFLRVHNGEVVTQPIKGTRPRSDDPVQDEQNRLALLHSEKDRAENLMIVDLLRNDLGRVCSTGSVTTEALFTLHSFTSVHHLISTVKGRLAPGNPASAVLRSCFPGGSITGAPKIRAMQIIESLEPVARSVYCGSVAWLGFNGDMDSNISIRTLLCDRDQIVCWGGGGIVADSDCDQEYQESLDKISLLINTMQSTFNK